MPINNKTFPNLVSAIQKHVEGDGHPWKQTAQALNFLSEDRPKNFGPIAQELEQSLASKQANGVLTNEFLTAVQLKTRPVNSPWLGLVKSPLKWESGYTYVSLYDINTYLVDVPYSSPAPQINLTKPLKFNVFNSLPVKRFIWVTDSEHKSLPTGGSVVKKLGLPHYRPGEIMYRIKLDLKGKELFVPTALDAEICEAWSYPYGHAPNRHGMTRHIENGSLCCAELLTEVSAHVEDKLVAELVGAVEDYVIDFCTSRKTADISEYIS